MTVQIEAFEEIYQEERRSKSGGGVGVILRIFEDHVVIRS